MNKQVFLSELRKGLSGLPQDDIEERLAFYSEMIDDRIEEGLSEEEAVSEVGSVDGIASQIVADTSLLKIAREKINPKKRLRVWEIALLALGFPVWLPLLIAALVITLSFYIVIWSVIISLWSVFASLIAVAIGGILCGIGFALGGYGLSGSAMIGAGIACAGLSIFMFYGCKASTKGILLLTKKIALRIKKYFIKKETAK